MNPDINTLVKDLSGYTPTWCPGCGNFGIVRALRLAFAEQQLSPSDVLVAFDIGCSGNMNDFLNANSMHTLHGRAITTAIGMKLAHHTLPVVVVGGDGGLLGEGGNHFIHACRGNHDVTVIIHDNMVYGLTNGQVAPTASKGYKSRSTPGGIIERPINALSLAITQGATFVAQAFTNDAKHLIEMIKLGMQHKGFSVINVLQPCVTFNKVNTYQYFMERIYKIDPSHDVSDYAYALSVATYGFTQEKFPLGILYQNKSVPPYHEDEAALGDCTLGENSRFMNYQSLMSQYM